MGVTEEEAVDLTRRGFLQWRSVDGEIYAMPTVVRVLAVRERAA
jgi:hypothetical protein